MADDAGALLVRSGLITPSSLDQARSRVDEHGGTIGEHLVVSGAIEDDALTDFYKARLLVPQVNPNSLARLPIRVIAAIPNDMAIELRAIPVALDGDNNLTVAMSDPSDRHAVDEIGFFTGAFVVRACATQMQIAWCLAHYYGHVTPLGQKLLQPSNGGAQVAAATPQPTPRVKGVTAQVKALRHRRIAPVPDSAAGADGLGGDTQPLGDFKVPANLAAPRPAPPEDTDQVVITVEQTDDGVPEKQATRAPSIKPPLPIEDIDSGPVITIERPPDDDATAPRKIPPKALKRRVVQPDPPELAARDGEIDVNTGQIKRVEVDDGPSILVDADAIALEPGGNDVASTSGELEVRAAGERAAPPAATIEIEEAFDRESRPILLERARGPGDSVTFRQRAPSVADFPDDDEVVMLQPKKLAGRRDRHTQIGIGAVPAAGRSHRDTEATPTPIDDSPTSEVEVPSPDLDEDDGDGLEGVSTAVMTATELDDAIPERSSEVIPGHLQSKAPAVDVDIDDGWGPPGTTIPPPLLGAIPGSDDDAIPGRIPMSDMDSAPLIVAPPSPPEASRSTPSISAPGDAVRELEDSTSQLLTLIRGLEGAKTRDAVVTLMIDHLAKTHRRAGFFVIKAGASTGVSELSVFAINPRPVTLPSATLRLDRPSTLQDVVGTRLPYRGPMHDNDSRQFLANTLGSNPAELLLVPIAVRERVVGVLFGEHRQRHTFDDQLSLAARAAGQALERILKAKRG